MNVAKAGKKASKIILYVLLMLLAVFVLIWVYNKYNEKKSYTLLREFASSLGQNSQNHIAEHKICWGVVGGPCGVYTHFTTNDSSEEFQLRINKLGYKDKPSEKDGYSIYTDLNLSTNTNKLTADGNDGTGAGRYDLSRPPATKWVINTRRWSVSYYDIQSVDHIYKINDEVIDGNIVTVMLELL